MAFRITATTDADQELLDQIREMAYQLGQPGAVSAVIRAAFESHLDIAAIGNGAKHLRADRFDPKPRKG